MFQLSDRTFLVVKWLRLCAPKVGATGLISGQGTKILHAVQCSQRGEKRDKHPNRKNMTNT